MSRGKVLYFKHVFLKKDVEEFTLQLLLKTVLLHNAFKIVSQQVKRFFSIEQLKSRAHLMASEYL